MAGYCDWTGANEEDLFVTKSHALSATVGTGGEVEDSLRLQYPNPAQTDPALKNLTFQFSGDYRD